ncbi:uncharacterized protein EV422DRAFT_435443 [Fimicolochytrium jonesii]|uniref:uncharacterized protein n=1 Tax=Fimicolochytrium jonesii TaxID=1396493 RepID=UPI0022FE9E88|nr:uncharacterized protein EV422DRAFT_435443 [Fimicolochytrium jonesii]KAI8821862.1 hypothetical protein EV422DRAFT_435443 [Fimicolochytrium jonesii]
MGDHKQQQLKTLYIETFAAAAKAVSEDTARNWKNSKELYAQASQGILKLLKLETDPQKNRFLLEKYEEYSHRAEQISSLVPRPSLSTAGSKITLGNEPPFSRQPSLTEIPSDLVPPKQCTQSGPALKSDEIDVLRQSSTINGRIYLPWLPLDYSEHFGTGHVFSDPDGPLRLSAQQKPRFHCWKRAGEIRSRMVEPDAKPGDIYQDVVTDCSVVASLLVSSAYEAKFGKKVVVGCIHPQNSEGHPVVNPEGKYVLKLIINGVARQVIVDDTIPVDHQCKPLCAFSSRGDIWPSIIEKAYLKVWGGYDFPGSNSGIDLHAMTGWIPENIFFKDPQFCAKRIFQRLRDGLRTGNALITIATAPAPDDGAVVQQMELIRGHAYAVIEAYPAVIDGAPRDMLEFKNPWRASAGSATATTTKVTQDGIYALPFDTISTLFETIHVSWNPSMWRHRHSLHASWPNTGPRKDAFNLSGNPQYSLQVDVQLTRLTAVWILLTKHVTVTEESTEYLTLHVYDNTGGERVYYPDTPFVRGAYINNPHILIKFTAPVGLNNYTVVLSQHEKSERTLRYTLTVYAMSPFRITRITDKCTFSHQTLGEWTRKSAGGSMNHPTFTRNPRYVLTIPPMEPIEIVATLEAPKEYGVNLKVLAGLMDVDVGGGGSGSGGNAAVVDKVVLSSGSYRKGFCFLRSGTYTIIPSTFEPGQLGAFVLTVNTSKQIAFEG